MLCERLMLSEEHVSVSGEVLDEDLWKVGSDGNRKRKKGVWESTDLSLEEMRVPLTELTPQACHILFSASLSKIGLWTKRVLVQSHAFGQLTKLNDLVGRTGLNRTNLRLGQMYSIKHNHHLMNQ